jgi:long-chain fatty acid transport protein
MKQTWLKSASVLILISSSYSYAAGFSISEQSITGLGHAFAGSAAVAADASTIYHNPAGLTYLQNNEVIAGLNFIRPSSDFNDQNSSLPITLGGTPLTGPESDGGKNAWVPNFYYSHRLNNQYVAGIGISAPFGLVTEYDDDWKGRYHAIKSDVKTVNINPSLAKKVSNKLSVGVGISVQYIDVELTQAVDFGAVCAAANVAACAAPQGFDGKAKLEADDWAWGFNIGLLYQITDATRVGLHYRSKLDHRLTGEGRFHIPNNPFVQAVAGAAGFAKDNIAGNLTLPESASVAVFHQINSKWAVMADATWMRWSHFKQLKIESNNVRLNSSQPENWENVMRYGIGFSYFANSKWTFRAGIAYDESPIPNSHFRTPRIADNNRKWVALGASYQYTDNLTIDAGYAHLFVSNTAISDVNSNGYSLDGDYDARADIVGLQLRWSI